MPGTIKTFRSTDKSPNPFSFTSQTNVATSSVITSNTVTISGINAVVLVTITGGEYRINAGAWTSAEGTLSNGQTLTVRTTSSGSLSTQTTVTVQVGKATQTFSVTTTAVLTDPYWNNVIMLMHMDGANGSTVWTDTKVPGRTFTRVGTAPVISTAQSKFGGSSFYQNGVSGQYLYGSSDVTFGASGAFTIEFWAYLPDFRRNVILGHPSGSAYQTQWGFGIWDDSPTGAWSSDRVTKGLGFALSPINGYGGNVVYGGIYPTLNTWHHFAIVRNATNNWKFYTDGVAPTTINNNVRSAGQSQFPANDGPSGTFTIPTYFGNFDGFVTGGNSSNMASGFNGYIDELRITDGVARYTSNFSVPTAAFPSI